MECIIPQGSILILHFSWPISMVSMCCTIFGKLAAFRNTKWKILYLLHNEIKTSTSIRTHKRTCKRKNTHRQILLFFYSRIDKIRFILSNVSFLLIYLVTKIDHFNVLLKSCWYLISQAFLFFNCQLLYVCSEFITYIWSYKCRVNTVPT